jgi:hypothetical protein
MAEDLLSPEPDMAFKFQFCPKENLVQKQAKSNRMYCDFLIIVYVSKVAGQTYNYSGFWASGQFASFSPFPILAAFGSF